MDTNWAAEHLQTIRTLMERSALYRRALAPILTFAGSVGILAALAGWGLKIESARAFAIFWMAVSLVAIAGAFVLVRKQALRNAEAFWSPPTRRVAQAMLPSLLVGLVFGLGMGWLEDSNGSYFLILIWTLLYGLALHAAGFFMPRGIRLFGWGFVIAGLVLLAIQLFAAVPDWNLSPHLVM